jgi:hypothetical protein
MVVELMAILSADASGITQHSSTAISMRSMIHALGFTIFSGRFRATHFRILRAKIHRSVYSC